MKTYESIHKAQSSQDSPSSFRTRHKQKPQFPSPPTHNPIPPSSIQSPINQHTNPSVPPRTHQTQKSITVQTPNKPTAKATPTTPWHPPGARAPLPGHISFEIYIRGERRATYRIGSEFVWRGGRRWVSPIPIAPSHDLRPPGCDLSYQRQRAAPMLDATLYEGGRFKINNWVLLWKDFLSFGKVWDEGKRRVYGDVCAYAYQGNLFLVSFFFTHTHHSSLILTILFIFVN